MTKQRLLGIALTSTRRRHTAVMVFYGVCLLLSGAVGQSRGLTIVLLVILCGMMGGVEAGGPVKPFESRHSWPEIRDAVRNNWGRMPFRPRDANDEYDMARRDHAHYLAYRFFRRVGLFVLFALILLDLMGRQAGAKHAKGVETAVAAMAFLGYVVWYTLPQVILLWTQQDLEDGDTAEAA